MVSVKHTLPCFDSEILVNQKDEESYELAIQTKANPLGFGQKLAAFHSLEDAVKAAERFCELYTMAREQGYYLKDDCFVKPDMDPVQLQSLLDSGESTEQIAKVFEAKV